MKFEKGIDITAQKTKHKNPIKRSGKGALIKGMSKHLPSEILESPIFKRRLREIMRRYAGIYALYRGSRFIILA